MTIVEMIAAAALAGLAALLTWLIARARLLALTAQAVAEREASARAREEHERLRNAHETALAERSALMARAAELEARLEESTRGADARAAWLEESRAKLQEAFRAVSFDTLQANQQTFMQVALATFEKVQSGAAANLDAHKQAVSELVAPVKLSLEQVDAHLKELERARLGAYASLTEQVRHVAETSSLLRGETAQLVRALRTPQVRGRWGELQLRRVVELAGMLDHCDFYEQVSVTNENAERLRPDMIVKLPGGKQIVIDAKVPLTAYLDALEAQGEEAQQQKLLDHVRHIRGHVQKLSVKAYWQQFESAPELVVLFLPGEHFFSAALGADPTLIEIPAEQRVIVATPTTLIALLRAVAHGWREERIAENAQAISALGRELHKRVSYLAGNFSQLGRSLQKSVESYNTAARQIESQVLVTARKLKELNAAGEDSEITALETLELATRGAPEIQ